MRRLCVARLRARLLIFLVARQVFLEFVTLAATRIVHRAIPISLYWIGGRRILRVPVSVLFLVRILIGSHGGLLAARGAAPSAVRTGRPAAEGATAVPPPSQPIAWTSTCSDPREAVMKTPQADGSSEPLNKVEKPRLPRKVEKPRLPRKKEPSPPAELGDQHIGATEDQVSDTQAPAGEEYKDEPRQG